MYVELSDTKEIKQAQVQMAAKLEKQFPYKMDRVVGWPSGHFNAEVRFSSKAGVDATWWYSGFSKNRDSKYNLFGRGNPGDSTALLIDLQFNFPVKTFNRKLGGVFVRDVGTHFKVYFGHYTEERKGLAEYYKRYAEEQSHLSTFTIYYGRESFVYPRPIMHPNRRP